MADNVETPASGEVQESTATEIGTAEADDLDAWADKADKQAAKARRPDGKYAGKPTSDDLEVANALKQTVQGRKPTQPKPMAKPAEQDEEEEEVEEEEEEVKPKAKQRRTVKGTVNGEETEFDIDSDEFKKLDAVQTMRASQKAFREAAEMRR